METRGRGRTGLRVVVIGSSKGGVGKSSTAVSLGHASALRGERTLLLDLDGQGSLAPAITSEPLDPERPTIADILSPAGASIREAAFEVRPGLDLVAAGARLPEALVSLPTSTGRVWQWALAQALDEVREEYRWCVIDTPPALSALSTVSLAAADWVIVPLHLEPASWRQALAFTASVRQVASGGERALNPRARVFGLLPTFVDLRDGQPQQRVAREILADLRDRPDIRVLEPPITRTVAMAEATLARQTILEWRPLSQPAMAYRALAEEVADAT